MKGDEKRHQRNAGLELMRLAMMFGIVVIHTVGHCAYINPTHLLGWCVCGFVFLSGYFGIRFSVAKCMKLVVLGAWCSFVMNIGSGVVAVAKGICSYGYWFLWSYVILMIIAPVFDAALAASDRKTKLQLAIPVLGVTYVWLFLCTVPGIREWVPHPVGFGGCSFLALLGTYVAVRLYKEFELGRYCTTRNAIVCLPICLLLMYLKFDWHWWIVSFVFTCFVFEFFRHLHIPEPVSRVVVFLAPSSFAVYLLHMTDTGLRLMSEFEMFLFEECKLSMWLVFAVTAIVAYVTCLLLDIMRRCLLSFAVMAIRACRSYGSAGCN